MWKINSVRAKDFICFNEVEFAFGERCYIIKAENKDNSGQLSNGGGKTSFMDIIAVSLLGYSITGRNVKDCVRWGSDSKHFSVELQMTNSLTGQHCFISRKIYASTKGQEVVVLLDDKSPEIPTKKGVSGGLDVKEVNKYILEKILCLSEDDLLSHYLISSTYYKPFLRINTDDKLALVSRFTNTKAVEESIKELAKRKKEKEYLVSEIQRKIASEKGYIEALNTHLIPVDDSERRNKILAQIEGKEKSIKERQEYLASFKVNLVEVDENKKALLETQDKEYYEQMNSLEKEMSALKQDISKMNNYFAGLIACPKCLHKFSLKGTMDVTEADRDMLNTVLKETNQKYIDIEKMRSTVKAGLNEINAAIRQNLDNTRMLNTKQREIESLILERDTLTAALEKKTVVDTVSINAKIKEKEASIADYEKQISENMALMDALDAWMTNFENFKFYLGNLPVSKICGIINQYLELNESDLNLFIEPFKKLRTGEVRQSMQPVIYRNWSNPQSYEQFSEGEKVRLNISVDLTFQQLINGISKSGGLDIYCNDELMNGLDSAGISNAAKAFDKLNKTILLVSHSGSELSYDNTVNLIKEEGITRLKV